MKLEEYQAKQQEKQRDIFSAFISVFNSKEGERVIEYLDGIAKKGFPDTKDVNKTYMKAGQMQLVSHIRDLVAKAKKGGV